MLERSSIILVVIFGARTMMPLTLNTLPDALHHLARLAPQVLSSVRENAVG